MLELVDENWPGTGNDKVGVAGRCRSRVRAVKVEDGPVKLGRESGEQGALAPSQRSIKSAARIAAARASALPVRAYTSAAVSANLITAGRPGPGARGRRRTGRRSRVRWAATWDATLADRIVQLALRKLCPQIVADLVTAAENQAGSQPGSLV